MQPEAQTVSLDDLAAVCAAYERKVQAALDFALPGHSEACDENWTNECLRCQVMSHVQVAFGFSRPLVVPNEAIRNG